MPLKKYNFGFTKSEFRGNLELSYGRELRKTPSIRPCGENVPFTHAVHCAKVSYTHIQHNEIRDTFASLLKEVCYDVETEPKLQSLRAESFLKTTTSTDDDARRDIIPKGIRANGTRDFPKNSLIIRSSILMLLLAPKHPKRLNPTTIKKAEIWITYCWSRK